MARLATTHRPPILASLCLLGAVVSLAPSTQVEAIVSRPIARQIEFSGDPRIAIPVPPIDQAMVIKPPVIDPLIFIREAGLDDVVSGFLGLLSPPEPPHC